MRPLRAFAGAAWIAVALLVLLPDPRGFARPAARGTSELLDPALRVPFAAVLLRAPRARLAPGERVLGVRRPGDAGLVTPRDQNAFARALEGVALGEPVVLDVQGPRGARRIATPVAQMQRAQALAAQWPACLAAGALLLFALACVLGGRHPVATPLFAVSLCLGAGIGSAVGLALPGDAGLLGLPTARARLGLLAWCALPAALLHLAARFPIVVPSFRRRSLAAAPYALWAIPALVAQLRFDEPAAVDAVERLALAASFLAGGILAAACAFPGRRLTSVERTRARAALAGFALAGVGPLLLFVRTRQPAPTEAALVALATLALPLALGWAVARHDLLDPPRWLRRILVSSATALVALLVAATATGAAWEAVGGLRENGPAPAVALALATALTYQGVRSAATRLVASQLAESAPDRLLARASRELAGAAAPGAVVGHLAALLREELQPAALAVFLDDDGPPSRLARRGLALAAACGEQRLVRAARSEDPDPAAPELVLALAPRSGPRAWIVLAPRRDGVPYAREELRALEDLGRLASLALADAAASAHLEERVASRTAALVRALEDRGAVVDAAGRIQAATSSAEVRDAAVAFLERVTCARVVRGAERGDAPGVVALALALEPVRATRFAVGGLTEPRAVDLAPQAEAVAALAGLALERIHLLAELKEEVARQASELAQRASREQRAALVREVAHELRKPAEEIRDLASALAIANAGALRIEAVAHELLRRLDCLLARGGVRLDLRPIDLVRSAGEALARVLRLRGARCVEVSHARPRLPLVADPVRIASLIENLLDNAWKATAPGGRVVLRTDLLRDARGPRVVIEVEDDGPGVPPDLGAGIFEPGVGCFQEGFGLGLALCRDVALAHHGVLEVESAPGRTLFRVELPQLGAEGAL